MKFLLHISASPSSPFAHAAFDFAESLIANGHELLALFFSGEAVKTFDQQHNTKTEMLNDWLRLTTKLQIKALCCSAAASQVLNSPEHPSTVEIAGLGQLIELSTQADRTICFGSREQA